MFKLLIENDQLNFKWWVIPEAGTYKGEVTIPNDNSSKNN